MGRWGTVAPPGAGAAQRRPLGAGQRCILGVAQQRPLGAGQRCILGAAQRRPLGAGQWSRGLTPTRGEQSRHPASPPHTRTNTVSISLALPGRLTAQMPGSKWHWL
uniref:Uncharacterized protein n=1 Tax=Gopherus evgoodei TaxID=1825980 RepID=A0A8C4YIJ2_9SAUR